MDDYTRYETWPEQGIQASRLVRRSLLNLMILRQPATLNRPWTGTCDRLVTVAITGCQGQPCSSYDRKSAIELASVGLLSGSAVSCEPGTARH